MGSLHTLRVITELLSVLVLGNLRNTYIKAMYQLVLSLVVHSFFIYILSS